MTAPTGTASRAHNLLHRKAGALSAVEIGISLDITTHQAGLAMQCLKRKKAVQKISHGKNTKWESIKEPEGKFIYNPDLYPPTHHPDGRPMSNLERCAAVINREQRIINNQEMSELLGIAKNTATQALIWAWKAGLIARTCTTKKCDYHPIVDEDKKDAVDINSLMKANMNAPHHQGLIEYQYFTGSAA